MTDSAPPSIHPDVKHDPNLTKVYIQASVDREQLERALSSLNLNEPLGQVHEDRLGSQEIQYVVQVPTTQYAAVQDLLLREFGSKVKFYSASDADLFFNGELNTLFVEHVHDAFSEEDIRMLFETLGALRHLEVRSENGNRYAIVEYQRESDAKKALLKINNLSLGCGIKLHVGIWNEKLAQHIRTYLETYQHLSQEEQQKHYQSLHRQRIPQNYRQKPHDQRRNQPRNPVTQNLLLLNMFHPNEEKPGTDWQQEIVSSVRAQLSSFGTVEDVFLIPDPKGRVYVRFQDRNAAQEAASTWNKHWFGNRQILTRNVTDDEYFQQRK